jgi:hypothetical protein
MHSKSLYTRSVPRKDFCPRVHTIKRLDKLIKSLQKQQHAIILILDANQTHQECVTKSSIKPHTIEWPRMRRGIDDPFLQLMGSCPNSTTYGILAQAISMLTLDTPAVSDHLGIVIDFDLEAYFSTTFSALATFPTQTLSSGNKKTVDACLNYVHDQLDYHKIWQHTTDLLAIAKGNPEDLTDFHKSILNTLDTQVTEILLAGENQCSKRHINRLPWSPKQQIMARNFSYWKQKLVMAKKKLFYFCHLDLLRKNTEVSDEEHSNFDIAFIHEKRQNIDRNGKHAKNELHKFAKKIGDGKEKVILFLPP